MPREAGSPLSGRPAESFSVTLNAISQTIDNRGSSEVIPGLGDLRSNFVADGSSSKIKVQISAPWPTSDLGSVRLTSITGYNIARKRRGHRWFPDFTAQGWRSSTRWLPMPSSPARTQKRQNHPGN